MAFNPIPPAATQADFDEINSDIEKVILKIKELNVNNMALTPDERRGGSSVGKSRKPFNDFYYQNKNNNPDFKPSQTKVKEADAEQHYFVHNGLTKTNSLVQSLAEQVGDIQLNSEHFSFDYASDGRTAAKKAVENGLPGADSWFESMDELYPQSSGPKADNGTTVPNP